MMLGMPCVHAQSEKKTRLFSCFVWKDLGVGKVYYADGKDKKELTLKGKRRTDYYPIPYGKTFQLFAEKIVDGEITYVVIGETAINLNSKRLLLIVVRNPASEKNPSVLPLKIVVMDDSITNFPGGSTKFINLTSKLLNAEINGTKTVVSSNQSKLMKPRIPDNGGFVPFYIRFKEKPIYQTRIFCQKGERRIIFITPNTKKNARRPISIDFLPQIVGPSFKDE
jgi:hypothetical protein